LGSILQGRLGVHAAESLSTISTLDPDVGSVLGDLISSGRVEAIPDALPADAASLLPGIMASVKTAFAISMHETFAVSAVVCLLGAVIALGIQNPKRYARANTNTNTKTNIYASSKQSENVAREPNLQPAHAD
jgi:hypothetical protein